MLLAKMRALDGEVSVSVLCSKCELYDLHEHGAKACLTFLISVDFSVNAEHKGHNAQSGNCMHIDVLGA